MKRGWTSKSYVEYVQRDEGSAEKNLKFSNLLNILSQKNTLQIVEKENENDPPSSVSQHPYAFSTKTLPINTRRGPKSDHKKNISKLGRMRRYQYKSCKDIREDENHQINRFSRHEDTSGTVFHKKSRIIQKITFSAEKLKTSDLRTTHEHTGLQGSPEDQLKQHLAACYQRIVLISMENTRLENTKYLQSGELRALRSKLARLEKHQEHTQQLRTQKSSQEQQEWENTARSLNQKNSELSLENQRLTQQLITLRSKETRSSSNHYSRMKSLDKKIEKWRILCDDLTAEKKDLKQQLEYTLATLDAKQQELDQTELILAQKNSELSEAGNSLEDLLVLKSELSELLQTREIQLSYQSTLHTSLKSEILSLKSENQILQKMVELVKMNMDNQASARQEHLDSTFHLIETKESKILELEDQIRLLATENEGLSLKVSSLETKIKQKSVNFEKDLQEVEFKKGSLERQLDETRRDFRDRDLRVSDLELELTHLRTEVLNKETILSKESDGKRSVEEHLETVLRENERLELLLEDRELEITQLKQDFSEIEQKLVVDLQAKINALVEDNDNLSTKTASMIELLNQVNAEKENYARINSILEKENLKIKNLVSEKNSEIEKREKLLIGLRAELGDLEEERREIEVERGRLRKEAPGLRGKLGRLEKEVKYKENVVRALEGDLEGVREELRLEREARKGVEGEGERLRLRIGSLESRNEILGSEVEHLKTKVGDKEAELGRVEGAKVSSLRALADELEAKNRILGEKLNLAEERYLSSEGSKKEACADLEAKVGELNKKLVILGAENTEIETKISILSKELQTKENEILRLKEVNEELVFEVDTKCKQINTLDVSVRAEITHSEKLEQSTKILEKQSDLSKMEVQRLSTSLELKNQQILSLEQKIEKLIFEQNQLESETRRLESTIKKLKYDLEAKQGENEALKSSKMISLEKIKKFEKLQIELEREVREARIERSNQLAKGGSHGNDEEKLRARIRQLESDYQNLEAESQDLIRGIIKQRDEVMEENIKLGLVAGDRLREIEKKSWDNEKLLLKVALCYAELDRLTRGKFGGGGDAEEVK